jgi:hypothetical protein
LRGLSERRSQVLLQEPNIILSDEHEAPESVSKEGIPMSQDLVAEEVLDLGGSSSLHNSSYSGSSNLTKRVGISSAAFSGKVKTRGEA